MQHTTDELLLTIPETARSLKIGRTLTYELIDAGQIQTVKIGKRRLVVRQSRDDYVASLINQAKAA